MGSPLSVGHGAIEMTATVDIISIIPFHLNDS